MRAVFAVECEIYQVATLPGVADFTRCHVYALTADRWYIATGSGLIVRPGDRLLRLPSGEIALDTHFELLSASLPGSSW